MLKILKLQLSMDRFNSQLLPESETIYLAAEADRRGSAQALCANWSHAMDISPYVPPKVLEQLSKTQEEQPVKVIELIDEMQKIVENGSTLPFSSGTLINPEEALVMLDGIRRTS